ncbi:MAG: zf-HC2 domain-containing protein [Acidobacteriia bacterium]|nr:zf-HC2 domain-containing protein [Terriglobia bacterium]
MTHVVRHVGEADLALYVSGDLSLTRRVFVRLHVSGCERCRRRVDAYKADRNAVREIASEMPEDVDWDRLAAEMSANIRVGLAAGECVAPRRRKVATLGWRPAALMAGLSCVLALAWWLNMPPETTRSLGRALSAVWHGGAAAPERGLIVQADSTGIELREDGSSLGVSQGSTRPVAVSVSVQGSASARYINADTGQITITSVYAQ